MPETAATIEPPVVVLRMLPVVMLEMAKEVVVALVKRELPVRVVEAMTAARLALS